MTYYCSRTPHHCQGQYIAGHKMQTQQPCPTQSGLAYQPEPTNDVDEKGSVVLSPPTQTVHITTPNIVHQQSSVGLYESYPLAWVRRMGWCHIAFGVLALMFQTIAIFTSPGLSFVGAGIWNGFLVGRIFAKF